MQRPDVLCLSGVDDSGHAGMRIDLQTFDTQPVSPHSVATARTVQSSERVHSIEPSDPLVMAAELLALSENCALSAVKIGMIPDLAVLHVISRFLESVACEHVVLDPVFISSSGSRLASIDVQNQLMDVLSGFVTVLTPNRDEAVILSGCSLVSEADAEELVRSISDRWGAACVIKGGHFERATVVDTLYAEGIFRDVAPRIEGVSLRGTGCMYASMMAARLAVGDSVEDAFFAAGSYVRGCLGRV